MSSRRSDDLVSMLNSLGFYTADSIHYTNGDLTVVRAGSDLVGTTIEQIQAQLTVSPCSGKDVRRQWRKNRVTKGNDNG